MSDRTHAADDVPVTTAASARPGASAASPWVFVGIWFAVIVWGGSFVAARFLLAPSDPGLVSLSPTLLAALRFSIATLCFLPVLLHALFTGKLTGGDVLRMAVLGQLTYSVYFWLQYTGVQQTSASVASILVVGLIPLATALLSRLLGDGVLGFWRIAALLLGLVGVVVIVLREPPAAQTSFGASFTFGALCLLGNAFAFAAYSNLSKRWMAGRGVSPLVMTAGTMASGALGLALFSLLDPAHNRWGDVLRLDGAQILALLFLALICSVAAYFAYNVALTRIDAGRAAVYIYFEPVVAVALGLTLLGEHLNAADLIGTALIALSVLLIQRRTLRAPQKTTFSRGGRPNPPAPFPSGEGGEEKEVGGGEPPHPGLRPGLMSRSNRSTSFPAGEGAGG